MKLSNKEIYIVDALRTPIGSPFKNLKNFTAVELGVLAVKGVLKRAKISKSAIDEVVVGNTVAAGSGQNMARQIALGSGLQKTTPAYTINNVCGSSLQALELVMGRIINKEISCAVVAGAESATHCPFLIHREDAYDNKVKKTTDSLFLDGLYCQNTQMSMGDLIEELVRKNKIRRDEMDRYSLESNRKAVQAQKRGLLKNEIVGIKTNKLIKVDDRPRNNLKLESLQSLPPAFRKGGCVTAGNASVPCDGSVAAIIASDSFVKKNKLKPKARILSTVIEMGNPKQTFELTGVAIKKCLKQAGLSFKNIDCFDVGEAFAGQIVYLLNHFPIPPEKLNIYGGDIAMGHPLGASGLRNVATLINALQQEGLSKGIAAISFGGGGAMAVAIELIKRS